MDRTREPREALEGLLILHWYSSYYHWERNRRACRACWSLKAEKCLWNLWPHTKQEVGGNYGYKRDKGAETDPIHTQKQECAEWEQGKWTETDPWGTQIPAKGGILPSPPVFWCSGQMNLTKTTKCILGSTTDWTVSTPTQHPVIPFSEFEHYYFSFYVCFICNFWHLIINL